MKKVRIARTVIAFDAEDIKKQLKVITEKKQAFYAANTEITKEIDELNKQIELLKTAKAEFEGKLKANFKEFDKATGIRKAMIEAEKTIGGYQKLGKDVTELVDYMNAIEQDMLRASKSENNSYKSAWEILVSCLTGTEFAKLANELSGMFKKNITEFKDAYGVFKVTADKQFDEEFEKMYNERKKEWDARHPENPLPELKKLMASRTASVRIAGILDYFKNFTTWVSKKFKSLADKFTTWINGLRGLGDKIEKTDASCEELLKACKSAAR